MALDAVVTRGKRLICGPLNMRCAVGWGGITANKREGDGATPAGCWPLRGGFYRADRLKPPPTAGLPLAPLSPRDGWCDAPDDPSYNRQVRLPYGARAERLWRGDPVYDLILVLGYNDAPAVPGRGSAIFLHVARQNLAPTEGCVALAKTDLVSLLRRLSADSHLLIDL